MATMTTRTVVSRPAVTLSARMTRPALLVLAVLLGIIFLVPFVWTISTSLKQVSELYDFPPSFVPEILQWGNYIEVWTRVPFGLWVVNTIIITLGSTLGTLVSASLVAYSFARFRYPGRDLFFVVTLSTMMLPVEVTIIPTYPCSTSPAGWIPSGR
jgi:multiple sugar transport system permease protein